MSINQFIFESYKCHGKQYTSNTNSLISIRLQRCIFIFVILFGMTNRDADFLFVWICAFHILMHTAIFFYNTNQSHCSINPIYSSSKLNIMSVFILIYITLKRGKLKRGKKSRYNECMRSAYHYVSFIEISIIVINECT